MIGRWKISCVKRKKRKEIDYHQPSQWWLLIFSIIFCCQWKLFSQKKPLWSNNKNQCQKWFFFLFAYFYSDGLVIQNWICIDFFLVDGFQFQIQKRKKILKLTNLLNFLKEISLLLNMMDYLSEFWFDISTSSLWFPADNQKKMMMKMKNGWQFWLPCTIICFRTLFFIRIIYTLEDR